MLNFTLELEKSSLKLKAPKYLIESICTKVKKFFEVSLFYDPKDAQVISINLKRMISKSIDERDKVLEEI